MFQTNPPKDEKKSLDDPGAATFVNFVDHVRSMHEVYGRTYIWNSRAAVAAKNIFLAIMIS